jgi:hypothetical protein
MPPVERIRAVGSVMTKDPHPALAHPRPAIDPRLIFACGVVAIIAALVILILIPKPEQAQLRMFSVLAGLGGASFTSGFTGLLEIETKWLKAGGPLAVFVFIVWVVLGISPSDIIGHG